MTPPKLATYSPKLLESALAYAKLGFPVVPLFVPVFKPGSAVKCSCNKPECDSIGKHPLTIKGLKAATTNVDQIKKWWDTWPTANMGIITGKNQTGKYLVAIDIDPKNNGHENWSAIIESHPKLPDTVEAITGSGGKHILFYSDVLVKNSVSMITQGVDVRGENGYIVAAPSLHASGNHYAWELSSDPADVQIAPMPDWLLAMAAPKRSAPKPLPVDENGKILEGKRNDTLFSFGRTMRAKNAEHSVILAALLEMNEAQCDPPLDPKAVEIIAHQASSVRAGLSEDVKEKLKKAEDEKRAQKQRAEEAKEAAKKANAKAKSEAMKMNVEESRRHLRLVTHDFFEEPSAESPPTNNSSAIGDADANYERNAAQENGTQSEDTQSYNTQADATHTNATQNSSSSAESESVATVTNIRDGAKPPPPPSGSSNGSNGDGGDFGFNISRGDSVELATLVLREIRSKSPEQIVYDRAKFWYYNQHKGLWSVIPKSMFSRRLSLYAGTLVNDKPLFLSANDIGQAIKLAADYAERIDFFNEAPTGILFRNCFVVVKNGVVHKLPHSPEHRARYGYDFDYDDTIVPTKWLEFLEQVFTFPGEHNRPDEDREILAEDREKRIAFLQEHAGASLLGEATLYGVCAVLYGESASNGKSVYLEVIKAIFPEGSVVSVAPQDWSNRYYLAELAGARLNAVDELPDKEMSESESFKSVVTGGHIMVARKNQHPFNLVPTAGQLFACNALPATKDHTDGFFRRFTVIAFDRKFKGDEIKIGLAKQLIETELTGIVVWAMQGLARLQQNKNYTAPPSATQMKEEWKIESDQVLQWMHQCTEESGEMTSTAAYISYSDWAKRTGHGSGLSQQKFWKRLVKCCKSHLTKECRIYSRHIKPDWAGVRKEYQRI